MNQALRSYVGAMGALAMLYVFLRPLALGPIGYLLGGAALLFGALAVVAGARRGRAPLALALVLGLGALVWAVMLAIPLTLAGGLRLAP